YLFEATFLACFQVSQAKRLVLQIILQYVQYVGAKMALVPDLFMYWQGYLQRQPHRGCFISTVRNAGN
ncbi:hypothetical protein, partial [Klebsiella pneumoniae]|uniref:hypothetical protein n=1 Tax=Klebsiella pneumoniae TaxID=573 RepID=UPI0027309D97